jgi:hypothetical protein
MGLHRAVLAQTRPVRVLQVLLSGVVVSRRARASSWPSSRPAAAAAQLRREGGIMAGTGLRRLQLVLDCLGSGGCRPAACPRLRGGLLGGARGGALGLRRLAGRSMRWCAGTSKGARGARGGTLGGAGPAADVLVLRRERSASGGRRAVVAERTRASGENEESRRQRNPNPKSCRAGPSTAHDGVPGYLGRRATSWSTAQPVYRVVLARFFLFRAGPGCVLFISCRARAGPASTAQTYRTGCNEGAKLHGRRLKRQCLQGVKESIPFMRVSAERERERERDRER